MSAKVYVALLSIYWETLLRLLFITLSIIFTMRINESHFSLYSVPRMARFSWPVWLICLLNSEPHGESPFSYWVVGSLEGCDYNVHSLVPLCSASIVFIISSSIPYFPRPPCVKPLMAEPASLMVPVQVPAATLLIQVPANVPDKAAEDDSTPWVPVPL